MSAETDKSLDEILAAVMGVDPDDRSPDMEDMRARAAGPLAYEVVRLRAVVEDSRALFRRAWGAAMTPLGFQALLQRLRAARGVLPSQDALADQLGRVGKVLAEHGITDRQWIVCVANAMGEYDAADYLAQKPTA